MAHITGEDRSQLLLLPDAVDDYVGPDNPVRFIDAFVDGLDLEAAGFQRVQPSDKGRPGYDPADLLKLYIYGYLNRIRSSRRLGGGDPQKPRSDLAATPTEIPTSKPSQISGATIAAAFRAVFRQFVRLCRELDLYGRELLRRGRHAYQGREQPEPKLHAGQAEDPSAAHRRTPRSLPRPDERGRRG